MRKRFAGCILLIVLFGACIPSTIQQDTIIRPEKGVRIPSHVRRLAVAEFQDSRADKSDFPDLKSELQKRIISGLIAERIDVVERSSLQLVLKEKALGQSGLLQPEEVHELGGLLGVDAVLVGEIHDYGKVITPVAKLDLSCRLVDVRSGRILFALQVDARKTNMKYPFELHREVIEEAALQTVKAIRREGI